MPILEEGDKPTFLEEGYALLEKSDFIKGRVKVAEFAYKEAHKGASMDDHLRVTLAHTLKNTWESCQELGLIPANKRMAEAVLREDTTSGNVARFVPHQFDVITALIPNLVIDEIASIQPMDRRTGEVYFLDFLRGITKGRHTAGDTALDAKSGANSGILDGEYSTDDVTEGIGTGTGADQNLAGNTGHTDIVPGTVVLVDESESILVSDDGIGNLVGDVNAGTNTIDYATGAFDVNVTAVSGETVFLRYQVDQEQNPDAIGSVELRLRSEIVTARRHALRARWLMDAEWDLQKAHGKSAGDELLAEVVNEVKRDIEVRFMDLLWKQATNAATPDTYDANVPAVGVTQFDHFRTIKTRLSSNSMQILSDTQRAAGNFLIVGTGGATILMALGEPDFRPLVDMANPPAGPHVCGILSNRWRVICNPAPAWRDRVLIGHKGDSFLNAGAVWAPYRPIVVTQRVVLDDLKNRQAVLSYSAQKMINNSMFRQLVIANAP